MAISCYFGLTESGKSYHVQKHVMPELKKTIVFDNARCFTGESVFNAPTDADFVKIFRKLKGKEKFSLVIRPSRTCDLVKLSDKTISLALALGRTAGVGGASVDVQNRVNLMIDEADFVCSPHFQSYALKDLVNKGRHDHVDSHFIARVPMQLHNDIRRNVSKIVTFRLQNAREIPLFRDNFGIDLSSKIKDLPKYHRLEWKDNGEVNIYNEKNTAYSWQNHGKKGGE